MRIGFDAKRAFFNKSGLGNYSRDTISILTGNYSEHSYFLYTPPGTPTVNFTTGSPVSVCKPMNYVGRKLPFFWRSFMLPNQLKIDRIDLFHGLSNEIPFNIKNSGIKSVITIHDLIFLRFPEWYPFIDRKIYEVKFRRSCRNADGIIAISKQTKNDIIEFFGIDPDKIDVVYQGCNTVFQKKADTKQVSWIRKKYSIPDEYLLYVGTVEKRKNLLTIIKALKISNLNIPLVIVGRHTSYTGQVKNYIRNKNMKNIQFIKHVDTNELPVFYQNAKIFIYPSIFEGFGIPIQEALFSKTPVITSKAGCFHESGGPASIYIDPENAEDFADAILKLLKDTSFREKVVSEGYTYAQNFTNEKIAKNLMEVYKKIV
jgi:glycosyltransferase involved in cell wall biosynthesis